jgi:hypothetical protein
MPRTVSKNGKRYDQLIGSRAQVWHNTAYKTSGGLTKSNLLMNKLGRIVSLKKHNTAKREKRLEKAGYKPKKGVFKIFRKLSSTARRSRSRR